VKGPTAVVLAAGKGTRMNSELPKVLHPVCGRAMVRYVVEALQEAGIDDIIVVVGYKEELVREELGNAGVEFVIQKDQLGTGHAVMEARDLLASRPGPVIVTYGDMPLLTAATFRGILEHHRQRKPAVTILTAVLDRHLPYGRVIRAGNASNARIVRIVEEKDATPDELAIREVNTGTYCFEKESLLTTLPDLDRSNAQAEYYITDIPEILARRGDLVQGWRLDDPDEALGINTRLHLADVEKTMRRRINIRLMESGVTLVDPDTAYIDAGVEIEPETVVEPNVIIRGKTRILSDCRIGPDTEVHDSIIGPSTTVVRSVIIESTTGCQCMIGPYSYLRPMCELADGVKVGAFCELKKAVVGKGSKIPHLSYVGDTCIGRDVNIGAGTITCNYDGERKHQTVIGDQAFIGSNANLVAPVNIGEYGYVAAGSTITHDVPAWGLAIGRARQRNKAEWVRRRFPAGN